MSFLTFIGLAGVTGREKASTFKAERIFQYLVGALALWLPCQWYLEKIATLSPQIVAVCDWLIWGVLASELFVLTGLVRDKSQYLLKNWLGIVIVFLSFPPLWFHGSLILAARLMRFLIFFRALIPVFKTVTEVLSFNRLGATLLIAIALTILCGLLITTVDPAIRSPWDGIWWAWETITTVGYGDEAPSTALGRLLAIALMIIGAGLFSLLNANLAALLVSKGKISQQLTEVKKEHKLEEAEILAALQGIQAQLNELKTTVKTIQDKA